MDRSIMAPVLIIICVALTAAQSSFAQQVGVLHWLEGSWQHMHAPDTVRSGERWTIVSDTEMHGTGYELHHSDTVFVEKIKIVAQHGELQYIVDVAHNPGPIVFVLTNSGGDKWVFVNPEHDFPTSIAYINEDPDHMTCIIAGNGQSWAFHFRRTD